MTKGPYDKFRGRAPKDIDPAEWDAYLDSRNEEYKKQPIIQNHRAALEGSADDLAKAGRGSGYFKKPYTPTATDGTTGGTTAPTPGQEIKNYIEGTTIPQRNALVNNLAEAGRGQSEVYHQAAKEGRTLSEQASAKQQAALDQLLSHYADLDKQDQNALADYLAKTDPYMAEIIAKGENPEDVQRQLQAYNTQKEAVDKYKSLSDPAVTAQERYMSELARRGFESADRSNRMAVSEQMANRGLRSGGQEIAANQSSQEQLAQDRLLKELGIQSQAVGRSMDALKGWSEGANQLSTAAGAIRSADASERHWQDNFKAQEATRVSNLASARKTASDTTTGNIGQRAHQGYQAQGETTTNQYNWGTNAISGDVKAGDVDYNTVGDYVTTAGNALNQNLNDLIHGHGIVINEQESTKEQEENPPV